VHCARASKHLYGDRGVVGWLSVMCSTYIMARLTSLVGITPSFSPFFSWENSAKASRISCSSSFVMLCSFASFDCRALGDFVVSAGAERLGGYRHIKYLSHICRYIRNLPLFPAKLSLPDSLFVQDATLVQLLQVPSHCQADKAADARKPIMDKLLIHY
jgi:hypothetical protein